VSRLRHLFDLAQDGPDRFLAPFVATTRPRTFGGQVAAQALAAASTTVPDGFLAHSLHAYFLREADPASPIELAVDRTREGRSFCTRQVSATQSGRAVFAMLASFHVGDDGPQRVDVRASAPHPDEFPDIEPFEGFQDNWPEWDIRRVPGHDGPTEQFWVRHREPLGDDPLLQTLALTYLSDLTLLGVAITGDRHERLQMASLDHAMWFHGAPKVDDWLLFDQHSPCTGEGRALTEGRLYDLSGRLVASVVQEGLMRYLR
jgi:acyl-CoA thioesterase-2